MNEILDDLVTIFGTSLTGWGITSIFKGRKEIPAQDELPICMIYPIGTEQSHSGTVRDNVTYRIGIEVDVSLKQFFDNVNGQGSKLDALEWLMKITEERETDGDAKTNTIFSIINTNILINDKVLYTDNIIIQYDPYYNTREFPVARAIIEFTASTRVNRT